MKVVTDIKLREDWPYTIVIVTKQEIRIDDSGAVVGFGEPEVEEVSTGPQ